MNEGIIRRIKILVIEDNPGDYLLIEDYLHEEVKEIEIHHATTFDEAKRILREDSNFDSILLDLSLPDANGTGLVNEMINYSANIPIIVLTGFSNIDFAIKTLALGISDYLLKDELSSAQLHKSIIYSIERKRFGIQLKDSESKYRNLFQMSPLPIWVFDTKTLCFLDVNEVAIRHYGYSYEEFLKMTIRDIRPKEDIQMVENIVESSSISKRFFDDNLNHIKKDGQMISVNIQSNAIDFNGVNARLVLAIDITERLRYVHTIEGQNVKLREIAWTQSHLFRNPVASILGSINLMHNFDINETDKSELLDHILTSTNELDRLIEEIVEKTKQIDNEEKL